MNLTTACPTQSSSTCQVSCQDPTQSNQCILLTALLVDGSPCGYGGVCASGKCQSSGLISTAKAWFTQNLQIAIPVAIVAGLIALVIIYWLGSALLRCCRGRPTYPVTPVPQRHQRLGSQEQLSSGPMGIGGVSGYAAPPVRTDSRPAAGSRNYTSSGPQSSWVDPSRYNGPGR